MEVKMDRVAKYKFLGAALVLMRSMERRQLKVKARTLFSKWKYSHNVNKVSYLSILYF